MPPFDFAGDIWRARPTPFSSTFSRSTLKSAGIGATVGLAAGGLPGAAAGAGLAATFSLVSNATRKVTTNMERLEETTRKLILQYKAYSPVIARVSHQWELLDRRLNRMWAQTLAPLMKQFTKIGIEFRERWEEMKVRVFQAIEPFLKGILNVFSLTVKGVLVVVETLAAVIVKVTSGFEKLFRWLGLLPKEEELGETRKLKAFPIEWPTVEGPLSAAMRRTKLTGPPFTTEKAQRPRKREEEEGKDPHEISNKISEMFPEGLPGSFGAEPYYPGKKKKKKVQPAGVNVEVNVGDSKELTAVFERAWRTATYELHKLEAENEYRALVLQQQSAYT